MAKKGRPKRFAYFTLKFWLAYELWVTYWLEFTVFCTSPAVATSTASAKVGGSNCDQRSLVSEKLAESGRNIEAPGDRVEPSAFAN